MFKKIISTLLTAAMLFGTCVCSPLYAQAGELTGFGAGAIVSFLDDSAFSVNEPGFAGKHSGDISNSITVTSDNTFTKTYAEQSDKGAPRFEIAHDMDLSKKFTFQYNFYADGNAVAGLRFHYLDVFEWHPEGNINVGFANTSAYAERGQWHNVALTYDPEGTLYLYLDGNCIAQQSNINVDSLGSTMRVVMLEATGAGKLAFDDVYAYEGSFDAENDSVSLTSSDDRIKVDNTNGTIFYDETAIKAVSDLKIALSSLCGNYSQMSLFCNDYTELNTYLPSSALCVFKSSSKGVMRCYTLESMYGADDIKTEVVDGVVSASAKVHNHHTESKYATMIIAVYNTDRELVRIGKTDTTPVTDNCTLQASSSISSTEDYKLILIESLNNMKPLLRNRAEPAYEPVGNGGKIWDVDFDTPPSFTIVNNSNTIEVVQDDGNSVLHHQRTDGNTSEFYTDVQALATPSDCVVYEYDIKLINQTDTSFEVLLRDSYGYVSTMCTLAEGGQLKLGNVTKTLSQSTWYTVSVVYDFHKRTCSFYLDDELVGENVPMDSKLGDSSDIDRMRFYVAGTNKADFYIDNVKVYELTAPQDDISSLPRVITVDRSRNIFDSGYDYQKELDIKAAYSASSLNKVHPRIQAQTADFKRIIADYKAGSENVMTLANKILTYANRLAEGSTSVTYELYDGKRLLNVSRQVLTNMYVLGMAYQLTHDTKYSDRAWSDLQAVCSFPDWHPVHSLDPAEMAAAVSIGYDWMYEGFTPDQRKTIEQAMHDNFFYVVCNSFQYPKGFLSADLTATMNQNSVINGAITMSSLAFMDVYPEITAYTLANSLHSVKRSIVNFAPDGSWVEGPFYWEYAMQYTAKLLSSLDSALGTCFELDKTEGLDTAANFILNLQSSYGIFNYGDGDPENLYVPEILWLANKYDASQAAATALMKLSGLSMTNYEDCVLALLWLDESIISDDITLPLDSFYQGENVVTFRDKWSADDTTFVGIHGGKTVVNHSHLDGGSFVFDADGYRWARDRGKSPYDVANAWDTAHGEESGRWQYYLNRAEAHNTLVIDPGLVADHEPDSTVTVTKYVTADDAAIAVADTSQLYKDKVTSAKRGFFFTDNRKSLVVRDEIALTDESDVYWFFQTRISSGKLDDDGKGVILVSVPEYKGGPTKQLHLRFESSHSAELVFEYLKGPLSTSPQIAGDAYNHDEANYRIYIKMKASEDAHITVKLTPVVDGVEFSDVKDYGSIDTWNDKLK